MDFFKKSQKTTSKLLALAQVSDERHVFITCLLSKPPIFSFF